MSNIKDIIRLIDLSISRIETNPFKARYGFELAERELDDKLLEYGLSRSQFKNDIVKLYLPLYQTIIDGYKLIGGE